MRFTGALFSLDRLPIPSPTLIKEPVMAGNMLPAGSNFQFFYPALDSSAIQTLTSYTTTILTAQWPSGALFQTSVAVMTSGAIVSSTTVLNRRVLGIGPLGDVPLAANTYVNDPIPVRTTSTPTYSVIGNQAFVVTCTVLQNTLLVTPQFQGLVY